MRKTGKRKRWLWAAIPLGVLSVLICASILLQTFFAHRTPYFVPGYSKTDLTNALSGGQPDYNTFFLQTGLGKSAVDALLGSGELGLAQLSEIQEAFFAPPSVQCEELIIGRFTCEDRLMADDGTPLYSVPLTPLEPGDILVSFSTHSVGWRHGHAGLVVQGGADPITLEAVVLGSDSAQCYAQHWRTYSNFMVLRVKDADPATRQAVANDALARLDGIPYRLTSGLFGEKAPAENLGAQCAYLPWFAWQAAGYDLDGDGGQLVTVLDLAQSPLLEVVQVYGIDPRLIPSDRYM